MCPAVSINHLGIRRPLLAKGTKAVGFGLVRSLETVVCVSSLFSKPQNKKNSSQGFPKKLYKSTPKFIKLNSHEKSNLAILSMRKPRFESPRRRISESEIDKKMIWKQAYK